ncbi:hypothetical protein FRC17_009576 [Serendipita sp. 399]|nr:hypothetical protein FRC17_009576 [Serendipita sp. 399]
MPNVFEDELLQPSTKPEAHQQYLSYDNYDDNDEEAASHDTLHNRSSHWEALGREDGGFKQYSMATHLIKTETHWRILLIVGGLLLALGFATGHHLYLSSIASKDVRFTRSQFWVRAINNLFSHAVAITSGVVCTYSTVQAVWYTAGTRPTRLLTLNRLFSLPTPSAIGGLLIRPSPHLIPPLLIAIAMQALVLVTIFSPSTLTTGQAESRLVNISVPTLDLFQTEMYTNRPQPQTSGGNGTTGGDEMEIIPRWDQIISTAMTTPPTTYWRIPQGCGAACSYSLTYTTPALECRELAQGESELTLSHFTIGFADSHCFPENQMFYRANSSFTNGNSSNNNNNNNESGRMTSDLVVQYILAPPPNVHRVPKMDCPFYFQQPHGVACTVREKAQYRMTYSLSNNVQSVTSSVLDYGDDSVGYNTPMALNSRTISKIFTTAFMGEITFSGAQTAQIHSLSNELAFRRIFSLQDSSLLTPFLFQLTDPAVSPKVGLVQLFADMTIGLMAFRPENTTVPSMVWDGSIVWKYDRHTLLLIYTAALGCPSLASLYSMFCLWQNQGAIDNTFSTFVLTAIRTKELSDHFKSIREIDEVEKTKLQFSTRKESFILHTK